MKLTICFDDVSLPLPPMAAPDIRQRVIETVLDMAAEAGVDDVVLVAALALHRRMTEEELRHASESGSSRVRAARDATQHDAEDPDNLIHLGQTDQGEDVEINKRAATSDLLVYVNINLVRWTAATRAWRSAWPPTGACGTTTIRRRCATPRRSWTSRRPSCTRPTGGWEGSSRSRGSRSSRSRRRSTTTLSRRTSSS